MKQCRDCAQLKNISDFNKYSRNQDGLDIRCRGCARQRMTKFRRSYGKLPCPIIVQGNVKLCSKCKIWKNVLAYNKRNNRPGGCGYQPKCRECQKQWNLQNADKKNSYHGKRRAAQRNATPQWANFKAIEAIYVEAKRLTKETGIQHHVDHIYPLQSDWVCGLHVEENLRIITSIENIGKKNRRIPGLHG